MRHWKSVTFFSLLCLGLPAFGDTIEPGRNLEDNDIRALKEWINTKRQVSLKEIGGDLSISGEVRTEFQSNWERINGQNPRGSAPGERPNQSYDVEFNLILDYRTDRTWAAIKIEFDNDAGVFNGSLNSLALERSYWGVRALEGDTYTFDIEIGRRAMGTVFDSRIQFASFFDGILFRYNKAFERVGDFFIHAGPFVINEKRNQFGYIAEFGLLNIGGTGFYTKLSAIDWMTKTYPDDFVTDRFRFINVQLTPGYRFRLERIKKIGLVYSAFLWNFAAKRLPVSDNQRANYAGYIGFSIGQLLRQWDWAVDANYQLVSAQSIPDFDVSGNGLGGAPGVGFYTTRIQPLEPAFPTTVETAQGRANYHGVSFRFDLLLTDKLDMQHIFLYSRTLNEDIGPKRTFSFYELEFIYSW